jgi:hypothetical protein
MDKQNDSCKSEEEAIEICSNDGWNKVVFVPREVFYQNGHTWALFSVRIKGTAYNLENEFTSPQEYFANDFNVHLHQVILAKEELSGFLINLQMWLNKPFRFESCLSGKKRPSISVVIGPKEEFISKLDRPVFSLYYTSLRIKSEWHFVTDYTCINILFQALKKWLDEQNEVPI